MTMVMWLKPEINALNRSPLSSLGDAVQRDSTVPKLLDSNGSHFMYLYKLYILNNVSQISKQLLR